MYINLFKNAYMKTMTAVIIAVFLKPLVFSSSVSICFEGLESLKTTSAFSEENPKAASTHVEGLPKAAGVNNFSQIFVIDIAAFSKISRNRKRFHRSS